MNLSLMGTALLAAVLLALLACGTGPETSPSPSLEGVRQSAASRPAQALTPATAPSSLPSQVIPPMESLKPESVRCLGKHVRAFKLGALFTPILKALVQCLTPEELAQIRNYIPEGGGPPLERPFACNNEWYASIKALLDYFDVTLQGSGQGVAHLDGPIRFEEVAAKAGVDFRHTRDNGYINLGGGAAAGDFNGDGLLDIYVTNSAGPNALYRNNGDGTFTDVAAAAGVDDPEARGYGAGWADYDNDGDLDLFVASFGASKLFRNDGRDFFTDVTAVSGAGDPDHEHRTTGVAWGDYDGDGYLDLLVVRHANEPGGKLPFDTAGLSRAVRPLALYHNNGNGTFENVTALLADSSAYPSATRGAGFKPSFVDYDNDGDMDIYVVNDFGAANHPNVLWRNDGDDGAGRWKFTDVSRASRADLSIFGMALATGDYDNDGDLDFYLTDIGASQFLENRGDGTFVNITQETGTGRGAIPENWFDDRSVGWGAVFADLNNDGLLDLYVVAGQLDTNPCFNMLNQPNAVFINNGDGSFSDVSATSGADDPGTGRDVAYGDFNNDGRIDLFVVNLGSSDGTPGTSRLFQNITGNSNHWLSVKTVGTSSNRDGIGARIKVTVGNITQIRDMGASQGHMSHSVVPAHFGLGAASRADVVEVRWPRGKAQTFTDVAVDRVLIVTEP